MWWLVVALAGGGIAGFLVGGIGGRLAMLLLRVTTGDRVNGVLSDNEFIIGRFTVGGTAQLLVFTTTLGGIGGVFYLVLRTGLPARVRLAAWTLAGAANGGEALVHTDGIDFNLLEPQALAVALFVAIPAIGAATSGLLIERLMRITPWSGSTRWSIGLPVTALATTFALVPAGLLGLVVVAVRRRPTFATVVVRASRILIPIVLVAAIVAGGIGLSQDASTILSP